MRQNPNQIYSKNTPKDSNMTIYEMAESMSENDDAQEAFPYLVKWLLKDFADSYTYNGVKYSDEYMYNIAYFMIYNFVNRETCSRKPEVFKTKLINQIISMNIDKDFNDILMSLKDKSGELFKSRDLNDDTTRDATKLTTNDLTNTIDTTKTLNDTVNNESSATSTSTNTRTNDLINTISGSGKDTTTYNSTLSNAVENKQAGTNRNVLTDYPQSSAGDTTINNWSYASGASDTSTTNNDTTSSTEAKTGNDIVSRETNNTEKNTGTIKDEGSTSSSGKAKNTQESEQKDSGTVKNTGTVNTKDDIKDTKIVSENTKWSNLNGLEISKIQLDTYSKYGTFYKTLMRKLENCFISMYVDADRDGWIDPSVNLLSQW